MQSNDLIKQANEMIEYCSGNRSCQWCPHDELCNDSGYADNDCHLHVTDILQAVKNNQTGGNK